MRTSFLCSILFLSTGVFAQSNDESKPFLLKGKIVEQDSGFAHISYINAEGKYQHDSCRLVDNAFSFSGSIKEPTLVNFYGNRKSRSIDDPNFTEFYIEPTEIQGIFVNNHLKQGKISGSKTQEEYSVFLTRIDSLHGKWNHLFDAIDIANRKNDTVALEKLSNEKLPVYKEEYKNVSLEFIKQNPASYVSGNLLVYQTQQLNIDSLKDYYAGLTETIKRSKAGTYLNEFITKAENLQIGSKAPGFSQLDKDGKMVSLEDYKGNYVLLDFWASWCVPCRQEHPFLKKAYDKYYNAGFRIIGISLDKEEEKTRWLAAIEKDGLPWEQLCDFKWWSGELVNRYNLLGKGIPANFLIDREGKIIAKDLRGEQLERELEQLIK